MGKTKEIIKNVANEQKAQRMNSDPEEVKKQRVLTEAEEKEHQRQFRLETKYKCEMQIEMHEKQLKHRQSQVDSNEVVEVDENYKDGIKPVWLLECEIKIQQHSLANERTKLKLIKNAM